MSDIQILIRMSETLWNNLNNPNRFNAISDIWEMEKSVTNGKVLPEGHGNLKDEDEIYELLNTVNGTAELDKAFEAVEQATTIIKADKGDKDGKA